MPPANPPQLASPGKLAAMNQAAQTSGSTSRAGRAVQGCPLKRSWFSVTVTETVDGSEQTVEGLTVQCHLPELGESNGVTSDAAPEIKFQNLDPGGTGDVLGSSHDDDVVWEVSSDIS